MIRKIFAGLFLFLLIHSVASGQDVQLTGSARQTVGVGETFNLAYTVNAQATKFQGPNITGFDVLSGPFSSTSSSIRAINGRTSMSISSTYTYILRANKEGIFEIPAAT